MPNLSYACDQSLPHLFWGVVDSSWHHILFHYFSFSLVLERFEFIAFAVSLDRGRFSARKLKLAFLGEWALPNLMLFGRSGRLVELISWRVVVHCLPETDSICTWTHARTHTPAKEFVVAVVVVVVESTTAKQRDCDQRWTTIRNETKTPEQTQNDIAKETPLPPSRSAGGESEKTPCMRVCEPGEIPKRSPPEASTPQLVLELATPGCSMLWWLSTDDDSNGVLRALVLKHIELSS